MNFLYVGELSEPAIPHDIVECVTASALNAAIRAANAAHTDTERERLRVAEGAPANAGTDLAHAAAGLRSLYKLPSVEVGEWALIADAVEKGESAVIRGQYSALPANLRRQQFADFSHAMLLIPGPAIIDPLDQRGMDSRPIEQPTTWAIVQAFCASNQYDALIVQGPPGNPNMQTFTLLPGPAGSLVVTGPGHYYLRLLDGVLHGPIDPVAFGTKSPAIPVRLAVPIRGGKGDRATGYLIGDEAAFLLATDVTFTPGAVAAPPDCTAAVAAAVATEQADIQRNVAAAIAALKAKIAAL